MAEIVSSAESIGRRPPNEDVEKQDPEAATTGEVGRPSDSSSSDLFYQFLAKGRVEGRGIVPVPVEERTSTRYFNVFTIWLSVNTNILA